MPNKGAPKKIIDVEKFCTEKVPAMQQEFEEYIKNIREIINDKGSTLKIKSDNQKTINAIEKHLEILLNSTSTPEQIYQANANLTKLRSKIKNPKIREDNRRKDKDRYQDAQIRTVKQSKDAQRYQRNKNDPNYTIKVKQYWQNPEIKARNAERMQKLRKDPEYRERERQYWENRYHTNEAFRKKVLDCYKRLYQLKKFDQILTKIHVESTVEELTATQSPIADNETQNTELKQAHSSQVLPETNQDLDLNTEITSFMEFLQSDKIDFNAFIQSQEGSEPDELDTDTTFAVGSVLLAGKEKTKQSLPDIETLLR